MTEQRPECVQPDRLLGTGATGAHRGVWTAAPMTQNRPWLGATLGHRSARAAGVFGAVAAGLLILIVSLLAAPAHAVTEAATGTATVSANNGFTSTDFAYSAIGTLDTGTVHTDYTLIFGSPIRTVGTFVLTRTDGSTLTGTETSTVDISRGAPFHVVIQLTITDGTGGLTGVTGELVLEGFSGGPGSTGEVFTMTGTLDLPIPTATDKAQCKHSGWQHVVDDTGTAFRNQGDCVSFVETAIQP